MSSKNKIDDGGPAFGGKIQFSSNGHCANSDAKITGGMSLRDWFAGQALAAIMATGVNASANGDAADAYMYADAMLKARMSR